MLEQIYAKPSGIHYDESLKGYMDFVAQAHNQMLLYLYDPRNRYPIMEENPLHSRDLRHGVPLLYHDILEELMSADFE